MPTAHAFTGEELRRYSRQLSLPEFGLEGQRRLRDSRILIVGAGGLGCPAAIYLAAAGTGTIGIVDFDKVDVSNIHRQILYSTADIGRAKIDVARERILAANPNVDVQIFKARLSSANALDVMRGFDVVIDASDNFPTRYLVSDAAVMLGIPSVYGSVHRFEGQLSVFGVNDGPCYRCLFREPPPAGLIPNCAEAGVLGILPGIVGSLQATEAIKLVTGIGEPLIGRLLLFDALAMTFREIQLKKDTACPGCGASRSETLTDYDQSCGAETNVSDTTITGAGIATITPAELAQQLERGIDIDLVDVREEYEWNIGCIPSARLVPLSNIENEIESFAHGRRTVLYCKSGVRSLRAAEQLAAAGVSNLANLSGGITRWREDIDPQLPQY
jgi:adenylyltransferase/sulfurtransferase